MRSVHHFTTMFSLRTISVLSTILLVLLGLACEKSNNKPAKSTVKTQPTATQTAAPTASMPKDGDYPGKGKVTKINNELGSVELDHEEIVGVMPRMLMEFFVSDKSMLRGLSVGDQVDFVLRHKGNTETIVKITKAK